MITHRVIMILGNIKYLSYLHRCLFSHSFSSRWNKFLYPYPQHQILRMPPPLLCTINYTLTIMRSQKISGHKILIISCFYSEKFYQKFKLNKFWIIVVYCYSLSNEPNLDAVWLYQFFCWFRPPLCEETSLCWLTWNGT